MGKFKKVAIIGTVVGVVAAGCTFIYKFVRNRLYDKSFNYDEFDYTFDDTDSLDD